MFQYHSTVSKSAVATAVTLVSNLVFYCDVGRNWQLKQFLSLQRVILQLDLHEEAPVSDTLGIDWNILKSLLADPKYHMELFGVVASGLKKMVQDSNFVVLRGCAWIPFLVEGVLSRTNSCLRVVKTTFVLIKEISSSNQSDILWHASFVPAIPTTTAFATAMTSTTIPTNGGSVLEFIINFMSRDGLDSVVLCQALECFYYILVPPQMTPSRSVLGQVRQSPVLPEFHLVTDKKWKVLLKIEEEMKHVLTKCLFHRSWEVRDSALKLADILFSLVSETVEGTSRRFSLFYDSSLLAMVLAKLQDSQPYVRVSVLKVIKTLTSVSTGWKLLVESSKSIHEFPTCCIDCMNIDGYLCWEIVGSGCDGSTRLPFQWFGNDQKNGVSRRCGRREMIVTKHLAYQGEREVVGLRWPWILM
eukprot:TRINITY_DN6459_c0_g1_i18.p1 TRINITY_DN6459_c0_g1~~TRINITY_DN6459_c0_g1_i18.p1  ORF type:complete len:434 (-),score=63.93 TRINITY_DN6459_c0_g1_i18:795-2042(-)